VELLTLAETLRFTGLARRSLFRLRQAGKFPAALNVGTRNVLFRVDQVEAWLSQRGIACRSPSP
jgi:predicted DNA-binding transcriptional regulator AlpA